MQRSPHKIIRQRLWCVKRPCRFARAAAPPEEYLIPLLPSNRRLVVEHALVHRSELFYAEVPVIDTGSCAAAGSRASHCRRRQRQQSTAGNLVIDRARFGNRRSRGRKQTAVEGRNDETSCPASFVCEPGEGLDCLPQARRGRGAF